MNDNDMNAAREGGSDYLANLIKSLGDTPAPELQNTVSPSSANSPSPPTDLFSSLLSNPELLAKLPTIIATVKPLLETLGASNLSSVATAAQTSAFSTSEIKSDPHSLPSKIPFKHDSRHAALLCALKPYLSEDRCRSIDYMIKLDRLGDVLKTL
jgi:hypothetical protein